MKQCLQCNYEKTCEGLNFQQQRLTDCDTIEITEYDKLVASETQKLQTKVSLAIDNALKTIEKKQTELITDIKNDPRKSAVDSMSLDLKLKIKHSLIQKLIRKPIVNQTKSPQAADTGKLNFVRENLAINVDSSVIFEFKNSFYRNHHMTP